MSKTKKEVVEPINHLVLYWEAGKFTFRKKEHHFHGMYGYMYDKNQEGKRKLVKDVATNRGHFTSGKMDVVVVTDYFTVTATNNPSVLAGFITGVESIKEIVKENDIKDIYLITGDKNIAGLLKAPLGRIKKVDGEELTEVDISQLSKAREELESIVNLTVDVNNSIEGGLGNKSLSKQLKLSEAFTRASKKTLTKTAKFTRNEYEKPEINFNKVVCGNRWFFDMGGDSNYYDLVEGYRAYGFGLVESKKMYYGKLTPDVNFSKLYVKEPIDTLDKVYDYTRENVDNKEGYLSAGNIDLVKSKDLSLLLDSLPAVNKNNHMVMPYKVGASDEPVLVELINPPQMSYLVRERLETLDMLFKAFLERDTTKTTTEYMDITDLIYTVETNKKGDRKLKLNKDIKQETKFLKIKVNHWNAKKPIPLTVSLKYDMPERNGFNSVEDPDTKVWLCVDTRLEKGLHFYTIVETKDFVYLVANSVGNLRVLSLKEIKE